MHGKVQPYGRGPLQMLVKDFEVVEDGEDEPLHAGRLVPVYPLTEGLTQRPLRRLMKRLVDGWADRLEDPLPDRVRAARGLVALPQAIAAAHFPETKRSRRRRGGGSSSTISSCSRSGWPSAASARGAAAGSP